MVSRDASSCVCVFIADIAKDDTKPIHDLILSGAEKNLKMNAAELGCYRTNFNILVQILNGVLYV